MTGYREQLQRAVRAVSFRSDALFEWCGAAAPEAPAHLCPADRRTYVVDTLRDWLYAYFYGPGRVVPASQTRAVLVRPGEGGLVRGLAAANAGIGHWQPGWQIVQCDADDVVASRGELRVRAAKGAWRTTAPAAPGADVALRWPPGSATASVGYYMAHGDVPLLDRDANEMLRLYWHLRPAGAARFVRILTTLLNRSDVPFSLKALADELDYARCDAAVLYLRRADFDALRDELARVHAGLAAFLIDRVPALTKRIASGIGLAESPPAGESFGRHRCNLIAEALVEAHAASAGSVARRTDVVVGAFAAAGLSADVPYLDRCDHSDYAELPAASNGRYVVLSHRDAGRAGTSGVIAARALGLARRIAEGLCESAVWHDDRCTWLDRRLNGDPSEAACMTAIGPDVYGGTAGIGSFLAAFAAVTGESRPREAALGALRQALRRARADIGAGVVESGFFSGTLGTAVAAVRGGFILGDQSLVERGAELATARLNAGVDVVEHDLLGGAAGVIVGLLGLYRQFGDKAFLSGALRCADTLIARGERAGETLAWTSPAWPDQRALTGLSHGAAGIAYAVALAEEACGGDSRYREAVRSAFAYERRWYDRPRRIWADLREVPLDSERPRRPWPTMTAWCHGAPGIALARIAAGRALQTKAWDAEASEALAVTRAALHGALQEGYADFSPCHGLTGLAETLLLAPPALADARDADACDALVALGDAAYARAGIEWPCGTRLGVSPALFLGLAGIGHFFLRLHAPAVPSLLMPDRGFFEQIVQTAPPQTAAAAVIEVTEPAPLGDLIDASGLSDSGVRALIAEAVRAAGLTETPGERHAADGDRWELGRLLRDRVLPRTLPEFAKADEYLRVADADPRLWNSLPYMLAFGHRQAAQLLSAGGISEPQVDALWGGAAFSALLSVFDYLVDETPLRASVYDVEPVALAALLRQPIDDRDEAFVRSYEETEEPSIKLLLTLFGAVRDVLARSPQIAAPAWRAFARSVEALFDAERSVSVTRLVTLGGVRSAMPATLAKSVLPFEVLIRLAALRVTGREPDPAVLTAAGGVGRLIAVADDLADLVDDCRKGAPNRVAMEYADALNGAAASPELLRRVLFDTAAALSRQLNAPAIDGVVPWPSELRSYARRTVAHWLNVVRGPDDEVEHLPEGAVSASC